MSIVKLSSVKADLKREADGDWIEALDLPGVEFNVSSILLPAYTVDRDFMLQRLSKQYKGKAPRDVITTELGKLYAKHILHGWRGFDVEYSPEKALEILSDPAYRVVVAAVEYCAAKIADVDVQYIEDAGKNSERPSETD
ncbi:hypothetical protein LB523_12025 [Mesorhizobium sp. ESP-6-4]|uniref:hypothetical protein n=1 Tax=Mesorhizobium sp. ESP-6-4 TaxID=2876624 RepID=UPI001CCF54F7|nr:hypothetical protein [Mesorhizobium sp. ESP-6-4]MBZ9659773.1 hypothetical protein [Mesorhizobium sp. ESP-6-4]